MKRKAITIGMVSLFAIGGLVGMFLITSKEIGGPGPTEVAGIISENTTWTMDGSPYIIKDNTTLMPGKTLTIEAGTEIKFKNNTWLSIMGKLHVKGNSSNRVVFTNEDPLYDYKSNLTDAYNSRNYTYNGTGINYYVFLHKDGDGVANITYAKFEFSTNDNGALFFDIGWDSNETNYITETLFIKNKIGLSYGHEDLILKGCTFEDNNFGIKNAIGTLYDSTFNNNTVGLYSPEVLSAYNCSFVNNKQGVYKVGGSLKYCTITGSDIGYNGVLWNYGDVVLIKNSIYNNTVGVNLPMNAPLQGCVEYNNIFNNSEYNLKIWDGFDRDVTNNWWGTTDTTIIDQYIYDFYDDPLLGVAIYEPFLTEPNTNASAVNQCTLIAKNVIAEVGENITLNATLTLDICGNPIAGEQVAFYTANELIGLATTSASGVATIPYTVDIPSGNYGILAKYVGSADYTVNEIEGILTVQGNAPPKIIGTVPDQVKPEDSPPWTLNLTPYEDDLEDSGEALKWYLTGINTSLYSVTEMYPSDDLLTFTPKENASGDDEVVLWLVDSGGANVSQVMWVNITPVNDIPTISNCPDHSFRFNTPYTFNYTPYINDVDTPLSDIILSCSDTVHASVNGLQVTYIYPESMVDDIILVNLTVSDGEGSDSDQIKIKILSDGIDTGIEILNPVTIVGTVATGSLATLGVGALAARRNENWKYLLLSLFALPLYSRIHGNRTLDNFVRGQVYGHVQSKPGTHFNEIRKTLKLGNGNLAYHLRKLEKEGFIKSTRDKRFKRFYPVGVEVPEEDGIRLSKTQENILDFIEQHPKSSQKEIANKLKESQQTISYNINVLVREGFLKEEKIKGTKRYEIMDENT